MVALGLSTDARDRTALDDIERQVADLEKSAADIDADITTSLASEDRSRIGGLRHRRSELLIELDEARVHHKRERDRFTEVQAKEAKARRDALERERVELLGECSEAAFNAFLAEVGADAVAAEALLAALLAKVEQRISRARVAGRRLEEVHTALGLHEPSGVVQWHLAAIRTAANRAVRRAQIAVGRDIRGESTAIEFARGQAE